MILLQRVASPCESAAVFNSRRKEHKFFFFYEKVVIAKNLQLLLRPARRKHLDGTAFYFYYEIFVSGKELIEEARDHVAVKQNFFVKFIKI